MCRFTLDGGGGGKPNTAQGEGGGGGLGLEEVLGLGRLHRLLGQARDF